MTDTIQCAIHGEKQATYVCNHLVGDASPTRIKEIMLHRLREAGN